MKINFLLLALLSPALPGLAQTPAQVNQDLMTKAGPHGLVDERRAVDMPLNASFNPYAYFTESDGREFPYEMVEMAALNDGRSDETTIRELVAQYGDPSSPVVLRLTNNSVYVSETYAQPILGGQLSHEDRKIRDEIRQQRLNYAVDTQIERLEVAQSGDMAYEYGTTETSWDQPGRNRTSQFSTYVRVWRKIAGEWQVDVQFSRPNDLGKSEER